MRLLAKIKKLSLKSKVIINVLCLAFGLVLISGAIIISDDSSGSVSSNAVDSDQTITKDELTKADGKNGNQCLVAIDSTVYKIEDSELWKEGEHTTSNRLAYCGNDLTEVLKQSPHGRTKLEQLEKAGNYQP